MLQELLPWLPTSQTFGSWAAPIALVATVFGAALWLFGSRFSRSMITLILVSVGGLVGLYLPRYMHWPLDGWAPAVIGAVVLGVSGYFLHRFWVGVGLGLVLASWVAVATWMLYARGTTFVMPTAVQDGTLIPWPDLVQQFWVELPLRFRQCMPVGCIAAMVAGIAAGLLWPRVAIVMLYSMAGASVCAAGGVMAVEYLRPQWIGSLPAKTSSQVGLVLAMVAFGALLQWRIAPRFSTGGLAAAAAARGRRPFVIDD